MSADKEIAEYLRTTLSRIGRAEARKLFDVYSLYVNDKLVGFLVENQALVKTNAAMRQQWPEEKQALLFEGATNPMWVIEDLDDVDTICDLFGRALKCLPMPKARTPRKSKSKGSSSSSPNELHVPGSPLIDPAVMGDKVLTDAELKEIRKIALGF